jgi:TnpA family transposase
MPRRRVLTDKQLEELLALPASEPVLIQHWTLNPTDLEEIDRRRRDHNRLGFALQLCALRYPGQRLRPGESIPAAALRFVAEQVGATPEALAAYAVRFQTLYQQHEALRAASALPTLHRHTAGRFWLGCCPWRSRQRAPPRSPPR